MKQYAKWLLIMSVLMMILCCLPSLVHAQGDPGGDPDVVPVDGGLSLLAAAGIAYSIKKIKDYRNKKHP